MIRILIVEDELLIANYLKEVLELEGYCVVGIARSRDECLGMFAERQPNLVCMDIRLKGADDGIKTALALREMDDGFALIYLTAHGDRAYVEDAQKTHPSGYLVKPVSDQTIIATITTAVANTHSIIESRQGTCRFIVEPVDVEYAIAIDVASGSIQVNDEVFSLTPREMKFVALLLERQGDVVPFADLRSCIWDDCTVGDASLKTLVWRIRNKIAGCPFIKTIAGYGYAIEGRVCRISE